MQSLGDRIRRRDFLLAAAMLAPNIRRAMSQPAAKKRIALVSPALKVADMRIGGDVGIAETLNELGRLGYAEGENLIVERYSGGGRLEGYDDLAREVIATQPDLIYSLGTPLTLRFKRQTTTIPIVALTGDQIRFGDPR